MKKLKTKNVYKASNFLFDADKIAAWSYGWWQFVKVIDDKVVFNAYRYSNSTAKHQSKARNILSELGIKVTQTIYTKESLSNWGKDELSDYLEANEAKQSNQESVKAFLSKNNLKRLTKKLNEKLQTWSGEGLKLYGEFEGFEVTDELDRDSNGSSLSVQFRKRTVDLSAGVTLDRDFTNELVVYTHRRARNVRLELSNSKGKRTTLHLAGGNGSEQQWVYERKEVADRIARFAGLRSYSRERRCKLLLEKAMYLRSSAHDFEQALADSDSLLSKTLSRLGVKITNCLDFDQSIRVKVDFIQTSLDEHRITVGNWSFGTYHSLPSLFTLVKRKSEPKRTRLCDIGLERKGYYDHHNRATILDEHIEAAKAFGAKFRRIETANMKRGEK